MGGTSRETWAKRVERWKDSGLTAKEYAAELDISAKSLVWWKWRLGSAVSTRSRVRRSPGSRLKAAAAAPMSPMTFLEVTAAAIESEALEVVLKTGVRIRVRADFEDATLRRLLDVLEQRR